VCFAISDAGPGIQPEHLQHIFDRFWKRETEGRKGTGLGLFIAKGIVEAHGGHILVESVPGRGTTFYFTLPTYEDRPGNTTADDSSTGGCITEAAEAQGNHDRANMSHRLRRWSWR
jgi:K+-sensing histidine kinase KdpD